MEIGQLLGRDGVIAGMRVADKAELLQMLARRAAPSVGLDAGTIYGALTVREQLGSTGVGNGIAIPHARLDKLARFYGLFARLERAIDFAAIDAKAVDLVFLLLIPAGAAEHLAALASISRCLRDKDAARDLRAAKDAGSLHARLTRAAPASPAGLDYEACARKR